MTQIGTIFIQSINLTQRLALADDDQVGHIRLFLDSDGFETDSYEDAVAATIEWEAGGWSHIRLDEYTETHGVH